MAKVALTKVRFAGLRSAYKALVEEIQSRGDVHILANKEAEVQSPDALDFDALDKARLEFFIEYIGKQNPDAPKEESFMTGGLVHLPQEEAVRRAGAFAAVADDKIMQAELAEETLVRGQNEITKLQEQLKRLAPWATSSTLIAEDLSTTSTRVWQGIVPVSRYDALIGTINETTNLVALSVVARDDKSVYLLLGVQKEMSSEVEQILQASGFISANLANSFDEFVGQSPAQGVAILETKLIEIKAGIVAAEDTVQDLAVDLPEAKVLYDVANWEHQKSEIKDDVFASKYAFSFDGWMPEDALEDLQGQLPADVSVEAIAPEEGEDAPALLANGANIRPFAMLTNMYGLPKGDDVDPTPFMAPFFLIFFGVCLSDVGYGLLLILTASYLLLRGSFAQDMKDTLKFVLMLGVSATIGGVLLGGYFGLDAAAAPEFMTTLAADGEPKFKGQVLNALKGNGPLIFLGTTLGLGVLQLLFGVLVQGYKHIKNGDMTAAIGDSLAWFLFLVAILVFALSDSIGLDQSVTKWGAIAMAIVLVITQSRDQKNWLLKPIVGVLGLFGIMNYVSDILSYSRLMALGLATGVVGFAMNTTAGVVFDMIGIPGISHVVAAFVLLFGHTLNFALSMLGAGIHSMRLQFIEFFGRFYTGGAKPFTPFVRASRYLSIRS